LIPIPDHVTLLARAESPPTPSTDDEIFENAREDDDADNTWPLLSSADDTWLPWVHPGAPFASTSTDARGTPPRRGGARMSDWEQERKRVHFKPISRLNLTESAERKRQANRLKTVMRHREPDTEMQDLMDKFDYPQEAIDYAPEADRVQRPDSTEMRITDVLNDFRGSITTEFQNLQNEGVIQQDNQQDDEEDDQEEDEVFSDSQQDISDDGNPTTTPLPESDTSL
jgi:hypothetical protein